MGEELAIPGYDTVRVYDEVSSTMDVARSLADVPGNSLVVARRQSAGRGRQGRSWSSAQSAFMGTFVLCTDQPMSALSGYSLAVGVAIGEAISSLGGRLELKWPNDLVTVRNGELFKIGGILIEVEERSTFRAILVGLGLNVSEAPPDVSAASSLNEAFAMRETVTDIISPLAVSLLEAHEAFRTCGGFRAFRQRWLERSCFAVGRSWIKIDLGREVVAGLFQGVDANGALLLSVGEELRVVHSGHVLEMRL